MFNEITSLYKEKKRVNTRVLSHYFMVLLFFCLVQYFLYSPNNYHSNTRVFWRGITFGNTPFLSLAVFHAQALNLHCSFSFIPPNSKHRVALPVCPTSACCGLKDSHLRHKLWISEFKYMTNCYVLEIWHYIPCPR